MSSAGRSHGGEADRSRHAGYVMINVEQRGRLFFALNTRAGSQDCQAGVQEGEVVHEESRGVENKKEKVQKKKKKEPRWKRDTFLLSTLEKRNPKLEKLTQGMCYNFFVWLFKIRLQ